MKTTLRGLIAWAAWCGWQIRACFQCLVDGRWGFAAAFAASAVLVGGLVYVKYAWLRDRENRIDLIVHDMGEVFKR